MGVVLFLGLLGSQSRNVLFTSLLTCCIMYYLNARGRTTVSYGVRMFFTLSTFAVVLIGVAGLLLYSSSLFDLISSMGGTNAARYR